MEQVHASGRGTLLPNTDTWATAACGTAMLDHLIFFLTLKLTFYINNQQEEILMDEPAPQKPQNARQTDQRLDELNDRIDKAVARFNKMRKDYRFLAGPNWRETDG